MNHQFFKHRIMRISFNNTQKRNYTSNYPKFKIMKKLLIVVAILITSIFNASAGNYEEVMGTNIQKLNQTQDVEVLKELANTFDRIAQKEADKWLPFYYSAYAQVSVLFFNREITADGKNATLDKAQEKLDKAIQLNATESENQVLQGLIYQLRISDPSQGYKYSTLSNEALAKAETLNSANPRVYYLKGSNLFYTPAQYGGGKEVAKPLFEKAAMLFENSADESPLLPSWGSYHNKMMLEQCK